MNVDGAPGPIILCREVPGSDPDDGRSNRLRKQEDQAYHEGRERTERRAAEEATSPQSKRIHEELADAHSIIAGCPAWPRGH